MHPFSIFPFLFLSAFLPNSAAALKCFTCDGICDCRDNQVPETCAPDAYCYTIKAAMSGQVLRKGCTRECRAVSNHNWQKCHLCDDDNLCNNHEYRAGLFDDCAVEEFIGLGFGLPAKRRRPAPPNQQYRRSLSQYAGDGPVQNNAGGYAQSPRQNDGGYGSGGVSAPQQNQGEYPQSSYAQSPRQQQPSSGPSQNAAGSGSSEEFVSSPQLTDSSRGGQPVSARINAFLDRMSPRSVPLGFAPGTAPQPHLNQFPQQQSSGPQQNSFGTFAGPQQNSFGPSAASGGPRQNSVPEAAADFGQGVRIVGNGGAALNMANSLTAIGALLVAAVVLAY